MYKKVLKNYEEKMQETVAYLKENLATIRAGRATPKLLDKIFVNYYETSTPLNQLANISVPEPRMLLVQPYDSNAMKDIEKAILISDLGINPSNDGKVIRLMIPQLTEERRKDLVKVIKKETENSKVAIRNERRDAMDKIKKMEKVSDITEDDRKLAEKEIQELTNKYIDEMEMILAAKDKEIMAV